MDATRSAKGAIAGAVAATVWAAQQPLDRRVFGCDHDDLALLGKAVTRGPAWPLAGLAIHASFGALFGALYAQARPFLPGPPAARGALAALAEHTATWPLTRAVDALHPAREELVPLAGSRRALAQATWRHALFGAVLGDLEARLNRDRHEEPPPIPVSSNGHGNIESAVAAA